MMRTRMKRRQADQVSPYHEPKRLRVKMKTTTLTDMIRMTMRRKWRKL